MSFCGNMEEFNMNEENELKCSYSYSTQQKAKELRIIDDALFRLIAEREGVCQEILRTLLDDDELEVINVTAQAEISSLERAVILDALCKLKDGTYCNVEMQKSDAEDDIKRVRFHASTITANKTPKSTAFRNIPNVKILYITTYDALGNNQTITPLCRCQKKGDNYEPVNDGEIIIFANTAVKDGTKHTELLQLFLSKDSFDSKDYPNLSDAIHHFKDTKEGVNEMCESIEAYANEIADARAIDATIITCLDFNQSKVDTLNYVKSKFPDTSDSYIQERIDTLYNKEAD